VELVAVAEAQPELQAELQPEATAEAAALDEVPAGDKLARKEPRKAAEEVEDDEHAKDGVSLDELFSMKPEIFQTAATEDDESGDKKKGKKGKKKSVELEFDEERGEVVGRKKHKRGDDELGGEW
jgi:N utilization substance protein A